MKISKLQFKKFFTFHIKKPVYSVDKLWKMWDKCVNYILPVQKQPEFFAQCCYESNFFTTVKENLNYFTAGRITKVWPKIKREEAEKLTGNPSALAKAVYLHHATLNNDSAEAKKLYAKGWEVLDFAGQGFIQFTGFYNWNKFKKKTKINCFKDKEYFAKYPWLGSAYYWIEADIDYCITFEQMTKKINGGLIGIEKRKRMLSWIYEIMYHNQMSARQIRGSK